MKSLISAFALAAVMGIAAAATPASAADLSAEVVTPVATGANNCVVVNDGHYDFGEQVCTRKYPWWYTPVRYKNKNGGNYQYTTERSSPPDHNCPPPKWDKPKWDGPKWNGPKYPVRDIK